MKDEVFENWETKKEYIKTNYPHVTEEDLIYKAGEEIQLLENLQKKLKKSKQEVRNLLTYIGYK